MSTRRRVRNNPSSTLGVLCLLLGCADLHAPPAANEGGAPLQNASGGASGNGGMGTSGSAGGMGSDSNAGGAVGAGVAGSGEAGVGGASPPGGSSGTATGGASGGNSEVGGSAALAGGGGTAGAAGGGGGTGGQGEAACQSKTTGEIRAWFYPELPDQFSNEIHPFVVLTNSGSDIPLKQLAIRYYFSAEMSGDFQTSCIWVPKQGGGGLCGSGVSVKIVSLDPPRPQADHYLEVSFPDVATDTLSSVPNPVFEARSRFWRVGNPLMNQANDYSFVPTTNEVMTVESRDYKATSKVTVYRNGVLVWGDEPCP